jgi:predicted metal-binding protein
LATKKVSEFERERSRLSFERRAGLPMKQDRPTSIVKWVVEKKDLEELTGVAKKKIEEINKRTKSNSTGMAMIITTDKIVIDPRARWKCIIPMCFGYGSSPCCPPYSPTHEETQEIVSRYKYAILIRYMPPVGDQIYPDFLTRTYQRVNELNEIVAAVETEANYRGYHLAMGFKGGPCGDCGIFSPEYVADWFAGKEMPRCPVLDGKMCNSYLRPRPAMEASGIDVFATARNAGWESPYIIMPEHAKTSVPCVSWHGLVLVA